MAEPVMVIPLEYEHHAETSARMRLRTRAHWLLILAWAVCAGTWAAIVLIDTHLAVVGGPVIALLGVAMAVTGFSGRRPAYALLGLAHLAVCVLFVTLVNLLTWSPRDAHWPFTVMGALHVIATGLASARLFLRRQHRPLDARI